MANPKKISRFMEESKDTPVINELEAFIDKVKTDISNGNITEAAGNNLINKATNLLNMIKT